MKKTIVYIGGFELPDKNAAAHRVLSNAKIFRDLGFEVVLIGFSKGVDRENPIRQTVEGFDSWSIKYPSTIQEWAQAAVGISVLNQIIGVHYSKDLFSVVYYNYYSVSQMRLASSLLSNDVKHLADVTEWDATDARSLRGAVRAVDTWLRMHRVNRSVDGLITTSPYLSRYYKNDKRPILELPSLFDTMGDRFQSKVGLRLSKNRSLIYAGNPFNTSSKPGAPVKDRLDAVVGMVLNLPKARKITLTVMGVTLGEYVQFFPHHETQLKSKDCRVQFFGRVSSRAVTDQYRRSDASIFFREDDRVTKSGFPTKFSESISLGVPVITNPLENVSRFLEEGYGLSVSYSSPDGVSRLDQILFGDERSLDYATQKCEQEKPFDYRQYIEPAREFFSTLNSE